MDCFFGKFNLSKTLDLIEDISVCGSGREKGTLSGGLKRLSVVLKRAGPLALMLREGTH